jgi:hypothetical protein
MDECPLSLDIWPHIEKFMREEILDMMQDIKADPNGMRWAYHAYCLFVQGTCHTLRAVLAHGNAYAKELPTRRCRNRVTLAAAARLLIANYEDRPFVHGTNVSEVEYFLAQSTASMDEVCILDPMCCGVGFELRDIDEWVIFHSFQTKLSTLLNTSGLMPKIIETNWRRIRILTFDRPVNCIEDFEEHKRRATEDGRILLCARTPGK